MQKKTNKPETDKKRKKVTVTPVRLYPVTVQMVEEPDRPDADGLYTFTPVFPYGGSPSFRLKARTPEKAARLFCEYVINELDGRDDAREDA